MYSARLARATDEKMLKRNYMQFKTKQDLINFLEKEIIDFTKMEYFADEINDEYEQIMQENKDLNENQKDEIFEFKYQQLNDKIRKFEKANHCELYFNDSDNERPYYFYEVEKKYFYNFCLREIDKIFNNFKINDIQSNAYDTSFYFEFLDDENETQEIRLSNHKQKSYGIFKSFDHEYFQNIIYRI